VRRFRSGVACECGQAATEHALLLALLLGAAVAGGAWVLERHHELLRAIEVAAASYWFVLSLPVP
jgi:hypothetical protein